jgi:hypothetical protein
MIECKVYIWTREDSRGLLQYGAEVSWPPENDHDWYGSHWFYTPLFDSRHELELHVSELLKKLNLVEVSL